MNTKTFLGNAVLQNFTLASFRMERMKAWRNPAEQSGETPETITKEALADPDKLVHDAAFKRSLEDFIKSKGITDKDHPLSLLKSASDPEKASVDPETRLVLASLTRILGETLTSGKGRNADKETERAAKALSAKLPEAFAEISREYERGRAIEKAGKETVEFKIKFERQVDKAKNQMDEPWYGIPTETRDEVYDLCDKAGIKPESLWYAIVDDYKLDDKELSAMSRIDRKQLKDNAPIKALVAQVKELKGYIERVGRPQGSQWDLYPNWNKGRVDGWVMPNAIAPSGAGMFFDIKVDQSDLRITHVKLSKAGRPVPVDPDSRGTAADKAIHIRVKGVEYKLTSRNGHKAVVETAADDNDRDFDKVKVGKTMLPLNEVSDEYTNTGNLKVAFERGLEQQLKGYDVKSLLPLVLKYAELKTGGGIKAEMLDVSRGQKKTGKFLGMFGGKSQDVIVFDQETFTKLNSSFEEFKAWIDSGKAAPAEGKKEKKEKVRMAGSKAYQEFYDRDGASADAKRAYGLMAVLDADNDGIFNQIAAAKGKTVEDLARGGTLFGKINEEGNAPVDLQLWTVLAKKNPQEANNSFNRILELGSIDGKPVPEVDLNALKPNDVNDAMRRAYARGRDRAAAMTEGNLNEYVQGGLGGNLERKRQEAEGMTNRIMSQLEASRESLKVTDAEWNELRNGVMKFQLAFYLHWTDWRHYLDGKLVKHTKGIDGFGAGGRYRFELTKNLAIVVDGGVGRALLAGDLLTVANLGLEYSVQIKDASFRVSAGTGAVSAEASTRIGKDKSKEIGVNFYQSYFGTLTAVVGTFTWSNLNKELLKKVENSPHGRELIAMVDEAKGYGTLEQAVNGIQNAPNGSLKAKVLNLLSGELEANDPHREQKLAVMYMTFITEMIAQYKREAARSMAENRSLKSRFKPIGIQGGMAFMGVPVPLFGLIMRHSIEAVQPVKPATLQTLSDLRQRMDLDVASDDGAFGVEAQEKTGVEGETFESEMKGDMKRLTYIINEKGERVPVKIDGQGKIEFTAFKRTKGEVPGMLPDPYLDSALSPEAKNSLSAQGVDITGVQEGRGRSLLVGLPGLPEYRNQKDFTVTYRIHVGEGVSVSTAFSDKTFAVGGDVHSVTAYTRLEGNQAHAITDVYLASTPYEATLRSEQAGRSFTIDVSNYGKTRTVGAWPEGLKSQQWKELDAPTRVKENEEKSTAMKDYVDSSNARMEDLRNAGSVEAGEKNTEHRASIDKMASALAINLGPKNPKRKDVEKACFDLLVGSSALSKKDQVDAIATLVGEKECVAQWDAMSNVDRVYLINRIADAYFKDKPDEKRKDLAKAINKRVEEEFKKGDSVREVSVAQLTERLSVATAGTQVDAKALANKIYAQTYHIDDKGKSKFAEIALSNGKYGETNKDLAGYPIESLVAHKVGKEKFYGFADFLVSGEKGLFGMQDLLGEKSPLTPDEKKVVEKAFRNGLNKVAGKTLEEFDTNNPEQVRAFLRTPMVQQLRPALGIALGEELGRGLLVLLDNPTDTHISIHQESIQKTKDLVVQLIAKKEVTLPAVDAPKDKDGKDRMVTIKAIGAKALTGAYEDCLNFSMGYVEEYEMSMKLDYTETWKLNAPEGVGMAAGLTTVEYRMLEPVLKENRWSIIGGVLKCYMKSSATGPTTRITPGLPPGGPGVGIGRPRG